MYETEQDLADLQALLDRSYATAGQHLRSIFSPQRRMSAAELVQLLRGVFVLNVATVSAACTPVVAPVDGLFYRGKLLFGFPRALFGRAARASDPRSARCIIAGRSTA